MYGAIFRLLSDRRMFLNLYRQFQCNRISYHSAEFVDNEFPIAIDANGF
jgi:hypothetical protein